MYLCLRFIYTRHDWFQWMEARETPRMHKYGESKTTRIMSTVCQVTYSSGFRKFQVAWFFAQSVRLSHLASVWLKNMINKSPVLENITILIKTIYFSLSVTVFQCYTDYWFAVTFLHTLRFTASSRFRFFCFITLLTSFSLLFSGLFLFFYRRPGKYFLAPSVIWYTWYRSITFEHVIFRDNLFTELF